MGDILWAHLELLQKEVERERSNIENVPSNYSEPSFANASSFVGSRTYTQLDSTSLSTAKTSQNGTGQPGPPPLVPSTSAAMAIASQQAMVPSSKPNLQNGVNTIINQSTVALQYQHQQRPPHCPTTSITSSSIQNQVTSSTPSESWNNGGSNAGSIADGSEYSYHGIVGNPIVYSIANTTAEMKYSHQMAAAAAAVTSRASQIHSTTTGYSTTSAGYSPYHEYDPNLWSHQQHHPYHQQQSQQPQQQHILMNDIHNAPPHQLSSPNQWHQPAPTLSSSDFHTVSTSKSVSPVNSATMSPPMGLTTLNPPPLPSHINQTPTAGVQQNLPGMHHHPAFLQV